MSTRGEKSTWAAASPIVRLIFASLVLLLASWNLWINQDHWTWLAAAGFVASAACLFYAGALTVSRSRRRQP